MHPGTTRPLHWLEKKEHDYLDLDLCILNGISWDESHPKHGENFALLIQKHSLCISLFTF